MGQNGIKESLNHIKLRLSLRQLKDSYFFGIGNVKSFVYQN